MKLCTGPRDERRYRSLKTERRDYALFCVDLCGRVLGRQPQHEDALVAAANHLTTLGYYAAGLALDRQLATLRPRDAMTFYNLACSLALVGKQEESLAALEQSIAYGYADADHMAGDDDLSALRGDPRFEELLRRAAAEADGGS